MVRLFSILFFFLAASAAMAQNPESLIGTWQFKNQEIEMTADLLPDGTFRQLNASARGREQFSGRYQISGQVIYIFIQGAPQPSQAAFRFLDADTLLLSYPSGERLQMKRLKAAGPARASGKPAPEPPGKVPGKAAGLGETPSPAAPSAAKAPPLFLQRIWEPNEKAFTILVPKGWKASGGIFNVNPLKTNGPGNSIAPKCDFTVQNDARGTVMLHFVPSWNYGDLTYSPTGFSLFQPGSYYQGMLVRPIIPTKQFLTELFQKTRPQASGVTVIAEDPMKEVVEAVYRANQQTNLQLQQMGLHPNRYEALALLVEYNEGGVRFREALTTMITDSRRGAFMWTNEDTVTFRAPVQEYESWKKVLDTIRGSLQMNPQWVAAVHRAMGERAKNALETQRYINKVANEIVENRRRTHAEIRHENWLFMTGQEEYKNPFNGQTELGTYDYHHRWVNNQGEILYTDENSFDPNRYEEYNTREWKRTPIRKR